MTISSRHLVRVTKNDIYKREAPNVSFFVTLTRCLELIVKPLVAHTSDEIKTKMGRRKPFMLIGCGFYALFLVLLFCPPSFRTNKRSLSVWFGVFFIFFFMAESVTIAPYLALGPELSSNSKEREKLYYFFLSFPIYRSIIRCSGPYYFEFDFFPM